MDATTLFYEINEILRNVPSHADLSKDSPENAMWLGRIAAVLRSWNYVVTAGAAIQINYIQSENNTRSREAYREVMIALNQAHQTLRMDVVGPASVAIGHGSFFEYFDEIRKVIETATSDIFFIDPYLDAEFVPRYLCHVKNSVNIRLLGREKLSQLVSSVTEFCKQHKANVEVRTCQNFHDRYVFIDNALCYQSGASFKDGAKTASTTLTQITDAFPATHSIYEKMWNDATLVYKS